MSAIAHAYQYLYPSALTADSGSPKLRLATADAGGQSHPYFFDGRALAAPCGRIAGMGFSQGGFLWNVIPASSDWAGSQRGITSNGVHIGGGSLPM